MRDLISSELKLPEPSLPNINQLESWKCGTAHVDKNSWQLARVRAQKQEKHKTGVLLEAKAAPPLHSPTPGTVGLSQRSKPPRGRLEIQMMTDSSMFCLNADNPRGGGASGRLASWLNSAHSRETIYSNKTVHQVRPPQAAPAANNKQVCVTYGHSTAPAAVIAQEAVSLHSRPSNHHTPTLDTFGCRGEIVSWPSSGLKRNLRPDYWISDKVQASSNDAVATGNMAPRVTAEFCTHSRHSSAKIISTSQSSISSLHGSVVARTRPPATTVYFDISDAAVPSLV